MQLHAQPESLLEHVALLMAALSNILPNRHTPVLCCAVLCCAVLCCAVLCCAVLCCAVLWLSEAVPNYQQSTQKSRLGCHDKHMFPPL